MCGIVGYIGNKKKAVQTIFKGLKKLEYRGYDSWGIAVKPEKAKRIIIEKHVGKIGNAKTVLPESYLGIGHTRWATHGGVTNKNAHPHLDCQKRIAVIHNGIVENHRLIREKLKQKKHKFRSDTDTEVIAHLIEEKLKTQSIEKAVFNTFKSLVGSNAICVLDLVNEKIIACRDGSPLVAGIGENEYFLASDVTPFLQATKKALFLKDQQGVVLSSQGIKLFNLITKKEIIPQIQKIDWKIEDAQKGGYPHFFLKEIMEQKKTIPKTALLNQKTIKKLGKKIKSGAKVVLIGCGTAYYCALTAKYFFAQAGIEAEAYGAYEFLPFVGSCNQKTVVLAVSQSGETADTIIAVKQAKKQKAQIASIVNAKGSSLERLSDYLLAIGAGPEIAVVSTKAFSSQLATLYLLASEAKGEHKRAQKQIKQLGQALNEWLNKQLQKKVMKLARSLIDVQDIYLIGKHLNYPGVLEFALKIKEASYIHSEAFASGELKHGVISLVQKGTPCIVLISQDKVKDEVLSSAMEMKARGARIIGIAPFKSPEFDQQIQTPDLQDLTIFPNIIVGQLLGYYLGVGRGTDPDKPRNLAKSVTVK
jgi:glucosamine--fructose-6-phosphate aminotransferase (isomerizing)